MTRLKGVLVSTAFLAILFSWSLILAPLGWILHLVHRVTGIRRLRAWARFAGWFYARSSLLLLRPFVRVVTIRPEEALGKTPCIITANHQSFLDLYLLGFQSLKQVCPVARSWPFRLLFPLAPVMRTAGYPETEGHTPEEIAGACRERIKENVALIFYPEGHRSRTGKLGRFHTGAFRLALEENLPIVPMVIRGTGERIRPDSLRVFPGAVEVEMLSAIMPEAYERFRGEPFPHRALMRHVRALYEQSLGPDRAKRG